MLELRGNLFDQRCDAICITTNGYVSARGLAVMGRGCAASAAKRYRGLEEKLGSRIQQFGSRTRFIWTTRDYRIISFPVKPVSVICKPDKSNVVSHMKNSFKEGAIVPGCFAVAEIRIICESARQLVRLVDKRGLNRVVIPRPGCGAGELNWSQVKSALESILDDRFHVITF